MDKKTADKLRGMIRRATIKNVRDDGETQRCSVEVAEGVWRDDVEVSQPFGFASSVPEDGALALVIAIGGDEGDLVVLPIANPSKRMGGLAEGEVGMYNGHGDKFVMKKGGALDMAAGASITMTAPEGHLA